MTQELISTYIPSILLDELNEKMDKIIRRANRIGFPAPRIELGVRKTGNRDSYLGVVDEWHPPVEWQHVKIVGEPLRLGDWTLVASIDPLETGDKAVAFFRPVPGQTVPESYRQVDPAFCDHCRVIRYRTETFLVQNVNNQFEYKQLGRNCIRDFLGHDPGNLIPFLQLWDELVGSLEEEGGWGRRIEKTWTLRQILEAAAQVVAVEGVYVSRQKAEIEDRDATSGIVRFLLDPPYKENTYDKARRLKYEAADKNIVENLIEATMQKISELNSPENDWLYNVYIVSQAKSLNHRQVGVAASAIILGLRTLDDKKKEREAAKGPQSEWVGQVGDKVSTTVTVTDVRHIQSQGRFGDFTSSLISMVDDNGNLYKTFYSGQSEDPAVESRLDIRGTIKKHDEYKGRKSTVLTRCKWETVK